MNTSVKTNNKLTGELQLFPLQGARDESKSRKLLEDQK